MRYADFMESIEQSLQAVEDATDAADPSERAEFLRALAEGLADDAAGRTMDTNALKASLESEFGPIAWR